MKIYNEITTIFNDTTGQWETISEDSEEYTGPIMNMHASGKYLGKTRKKHKHGNGPIHGHEPGSPGHSSRTEWYHGPGGQYHTNAGSAAGQLRPVNRRGSSRHTHEHSHPHMGHNPGPPGIQRVPYRQGGSMRRFHTGGNTEPGHQHPHASHACYCYGHSGGFDMVAYQCDNDSTGCCCYDLMGQMVGLCCGNDGDNPPPPPGCFVADTMVSTPDGDVAIQNLKTGDLVNTFLDHDDEITTTAVSALVSHDPSEDTAGLYELKTENRTITATGNHPFVGVDQDNPLWKEVIDFEVGDSVYVESGELEEIISTEKLKDKEDTFNLMIDETHTYIADGFRVHNAYGHSRRPGSNIRGMVHRKFRQKNIPGPIKRRGGSLRRRNIYRGR